MLKIEEEILQELTEFVQMLFNLYKFKLFPGALGLSVDLIQHRGKGSIPIVVLEEEAADVPPKALRIGDAPMFREFFPQETPQKLNMFEAWCSKSFIQKSTESANLVEFHRFIES